MSRTGNYLEKKSADELRDDQWAVDVAAVTRKRYYDEKQQKWIVKHIKEDRFGAFDIVASKSYWTRYIQSTTYSNQWARRAKIENNYGIIPTMPNITVEIWAWKKIKGKWKKQMYWWTENGWIKVDEQTVLDRIKTIKYIQSIIGSWQVTATSKA